MCALAYCDQMTDRYSFFLALTSTHPTVQIMVNAMETSPETDIRNMANRILNSFLQTNAFNTFGVRVTFHQTLQVRKSDDFCIKSDEFCM